MTRFEFFDYDKIDTSLSELVITDSMYGYRADFTNELLDRFDGKQATIWTQWRLKDQVHTKYPNLNLKYEGPGGWFFRLLDYKTTDWNKSFDTFISTFNGSGGTGRNLLVAYLHKAKWFDPAYSSKNFSFTLEQLDGDLQKYLKLKSTEERFYRKFFVSEDSREFYQTPYVFDYTPNLHHEETIRNMQILLPKLNASCIQIVGESYSTTYHPWVTEKFLFPVVAKSIWITHGQPGWYQELDDWGFRKFDQIFDYSFDNIQHPIERVVTMLSMLSKFSNLSKAEWHDIYELERETIEFNYDHYYSRDFMKVGGLTYDHYYSKDYMKEGG